MTAPVSAGVPVALSESLTRLTAPNPGVFTGPGTNTYLIGSSAGIVVVDPGPDIPEHLQAILATAKQTGGVIEKILVTHTHPDHAPGAFPLAACCGSPPVLGMQQKGDSFKPDLALEDGDEVQVADCTLKVVHTPGHASNHLCYLIEGENILLTGDHIMQGSTVVIGPPDGNMQHYMDSLHRLQSLPLRALAPGHGTLMEKPQEAISALIEHRKKREAKVLEKLRALAPDPDSSVGLDQLVISVYDDVSTQLHPIAKDSLLAHLLKLEAEGFAAQSADSWHAPLN